MKFNQSYTVNKGQESIVFKKGKGNTIIGVYNEGTLTGTIEGDVLKAKFHNKKTNGAGLIEFEFNENGFIAKWKQGLEEGPMRGKWNGKLSDSGNNTKKDDSTSLSAEQLKWIEKKDSWDYEEAPKEWLHSKEFILNAVKKDESTLEYASDELKNDKEIVKAAVLKNGWALQYASDTCKGDKELVLAALSTDGSALEYASERLKEDREVVFAAVSNYGSSIQYAHEPFNADKEIVLAAVSNYGNALEYVTEEFKSNKEIVLKAVLNNGCALEYASENLRADKEIVLAAISSLGRALDYASDKLKDDKDVVLAAVSKDSKMIFQANDTLKKDKEILAAAIHHNPKLSYLINDQLSEDQKQYLEEGVSIEDFDAEYHDDDDEKVEWMKEKAFLIEAVKQDERILKHASDELKADRELVQEAIKHDINSIGYAHENLQWDPEILTFRIDTHFSGDNNINITDDDLTIFLTDNSNPSILIEKLLFKVEFLFLKNKKEEVKVFHKKLIDFINANHECYWILVAVSGRTSSILGKFDNNSYSGDTHAKTKFKEIAELYELITFDIDFQPEIEFETYFNDSEIRSDWDACKWSNEEDDEGVPFTEFIMSETDMEWDTDSWNDAKYYNHAISRLWIALQNYSLKQSRQGFDSEQVAILLHEVIDEKYEPIQESGNAHFGSFTFETVTEHLLCISKNDFSLNETIREDLEDFNGWQYDLNKVASELCTSDLFDDWPGASEFAK